MSLSAWIDIRAGRTLSGREFAGLRRWLNSIAKSLDWPGRPPRLFDGDPLRFQLTLKGDADEALDAHLGLLRMALALSAQLETWSIRVADDIGMTQALGLSGVIFHAGAPGRATPTGWQADPALDTVLSSALEESTTQLAAPPPCPVDAREGLDDVLAPAAPPVDIAHAFRLLIHRLPGVEATTHLRRPALRSEQRTFAVHLDDTLGIRRDDADCLQQHDRSPWQFAGRAVAGWDRVHPAEISSFGACLSWLAQAAHLAGVTLAIAPREPGLAREQLASHDAAPAFVSILERFWAGQMPSPAQANGPRTLSCMCRLMEDAEPALAAEIKAWLGWSAAEPLSAVLAEINATEYRPLETGEDWWDRATRPLRSETAEYLAALATRRHDGETLAARV